MTTRPRRLPVAVLVVVVCAPLLAMVTTAQPARAQEECAPAESTSWGAPATRGPLPQEGVVCLTVEVTDGDVVRVQAASTARDGDVRVALVDGEGRELCGDVSPAGLRCEVTGPPPHRLLVSRGERHEAGEAEFQVFATVVDAPGCETSQLGRFGAELPVAGTTTGAQPGCFAFTAADQPDHVFSSWAAGRPFGWTPSWELWRTDGTEQDLSSGVPILGLHHRLEPGATYRLVRSAAPPGWTEEVDYRAGLIDSFSDDGCPPLLDIAIASPAVELETERGSVACRRLPGAEGTVVVNEGQPVLGDVLGRGMLPCGSDTCYLGSDPRLVSRVGGTHGVSDVDDTRRCLPWPRRLDDGAAPPVEVLLRPGRQCWTVETRAVPAYGHMSAQGTEGPIPRIHPGELWTRAGERCPANEGSRTCDGAHVVVVQGEQPGERLTALLRQYEGRGSADCAELAPASTTRLDGLFDEGCFTVQLPRGFLFAVDTSVSGTPWHTDPEFRISALGPNGSMVCGPGLANQCRTYLAGRHTISVVNATSVPATVGVGIRPLRPRYTELPTVVGDAAAGGELRLVGGRTDPSSDFTFTDVVWLRQGRVVGRGPTYSPTRADVGRVVQPKVTLTVHTWDPSVYVLPGRMVRGAPLAYRGRLVVRGAARPGALLRAPVRAAAVNERGVRVRYQWLRDGRGIRGERAARYRVSQEDRGHALRLRAVLRKPGHAPLTMLTPARRVPRA